MSPANFATTLTEAEDLAAIGAQRADLERQRRNLEWLVVIMPEDGKGPLVQAAFRSYESARTFAESCRKLFNCPTEVQCLSRQY